MSKFFKKKKFTGTGHVLGTRESTPPPEVPPSENPLLEKLENKNKKAPPKPSLRDHLQQLDEDRRNAPLQFCQDIPESSTQDLTPTSTDQHLEDDQHHETELQISVLLSLEDEVLLQNSVNTLRRILRNLIGSPLEAKFRKLNLTNSKVVATVVQIPGAKEYLLSCGFVQEDEQLIFPSSQTLRLVKHGLQLLNTHFPEPKVVPNKDLAKQPTQQVEARERRTQVLLLKPTEDSQLPEWFFKRTTKDIKAEYFSTQKRREQESVLMTRKQRDELKGPKQVFIFATIRIRLPEGVLLQGEFNAQEEVLSIHVWVAEQLRDPAREFELVLPSREKLKVQGTVRSCSLMPATLLSFHWSDGRGMLVLEPTVKDEILTEARIDWN